MVYKRLGELLVANEYITPEQLTKALELQKKNPGKKLGEILVEHNFTTQKRVYKMLERQLGVEFIDLTGMAISKEMPRLVPRSLARKYNVVPVQATQDTLSLAMADPLNFVATDAVRLACKRKVVPMLATAEAITRTSGAEGHRGRFHHRFPEHRRRQHHRRGFRKCRSHHPSGQQLPGVRRQPELLRYPSGAP